MVVNRSFDVRDKFEMKIAEFEYRYVLSKSILNIKIQKKK